MSDPLRKQRVDCPRCRYRFFLEVPQGDDWRVEAECPSCEIATWFTVAHTKAPPPPDPAKLAEQEAPIQHFWTLLWRPINEHRSHPVVAWMDQVGNGGFEEDQCAGHWPIPWTVYRFVRNGEAAYIWKQADAWRVRRWHRMANRFQVPEPVEVSSFEAALDQLRDPS